MFTYPSIKVVKRSRSPGAEQSTQVQVYQLPVAWALMVKPAKPRIGKIKMQYSGVNVVHCCTMGLSGIRVPKQIIITETQIAIREII